LAESKIREYILSSWISEDFLASDLKPNNNMQSTAFTDPKFTFVEKFLEKRNQRQIVRELLKQNLLPSNVVKPNTYTLNFDMLTNQHIDTLTDAIEGHLYKNSDSKKSLPPQNVQQIPTISAIPEEFMQLLDSEIFNHAKDAKIINSSKRKQLWKQFALWACFSISSNFKLQFRHHCRRLWSKVNRIYQYVEVQDKSLERYNMAFLRHPSDKLYIAEETTKMVASGINLKDYQHILNPQRFTNTLGETMVDFFDLDKISAENAKITVENYYKHMINEPTHQSTYFKADLIEYFGCFTSSNSVPYTTSNTASSHNKSHQECVKNLIQGLQPLSNSVNNYFETTYPNLYTKMKKLDLGPNVPKSFGAFPSAAINFNVICQFHRDMKDHRNTLCVVCPLGKFKGGELTFPELKLVIHVKQGQAVAFRSNLLVHGNLPIIAGVRHSAVFYIHNNVIKQKRKFGSLFADYELDWDNDGEVESSQKYLPPKFSSQTKLKNHRRSHLGKYN
jgi:hypothetical protein